MPQYYRKICKEEKEDKNNDEPREIIDLSSDDDISATETIDDGSMNDQSTNAYIENDALAVVSLGLRDLRLHGD